MIMSSVCGVMVVFACYICCECVFEQERPYHNDSTASRLLSEVKHCRARLVLRWGTTLESRVLFFCSEFLFCILDHSYRIQNIPTTREAIRIQTASFSKVYSVRIPFQDSFIYSNPNKYLLIDQFSIRHTSFIQFNQFLMHIHA
jgi:hypothetical protein